MHLAAPRQELFIGLDSAGMLLTPEEFDAIGEEQYDEEYRYELINRVLVVHSIPKANENGPNELLGYLLLYYQELHPQRAALDLTLPQQYVFLQENRRIADRLIWCGLERVPNLRRDVPTIAVEFVSSGRRNRQRDYVEKRSEYLALGIKEYWIIDRFSRTLTVASKPKRRFLEKIIPEHETYQTPLLPGFELPLARLLAAADRLAES